MDDTELEKEHAQALAHLDERKPERFEDALSKTEPETVTVPEEESEGYKGLESPAPMRSFEFFKHAEQQRTPPRVQEHAAKSPPPSVEIVDVDEDTGEPAETQPAAAAAAAPPSPSPASPKIEKLVEEMEQPPRLARAP